MMFLLIIVCATITSTSIPKALPLSFLALGAAITLWLCSWARPQQPAVQRTAAYPKRSGVISALSLGLFVLLWFGLWLKFGARSALIAFPLDILFVISLQGALVAWKSESSRLDRVSDANEAAG
jgi:hypothetical protein